MRIRSVVLLLTLWSAVTCAPFHAQTQDAPQETVQKVGSANWRIGSPVLPWAIYIDAPSNLASKTVQVTSGTTTLVLTQYSGQNDDIRVEITRTSLSNQATLENHFFEKVGGKKADAKPITVAGYSGQRLEKDGKVAVLVNYGSDVWGIALLPQSGTGAKAAVQKSAVSLWFERRETPEWKDRAIGTTSFQADLPFELSPRSTQDVDTVTTSARWGNFWVDAIEWRSGRTNLEGTVKAQIESLQKSPGIEDVRVKAIDRRYSWGFLENGERGKFVQIDYTEDEKPRRIYKVFSVAGTRVILFQLTLDAKDPAHLFAAHRILGTARLGWTDSQNFGLQTVTEEKFQIESDSPFKQLDGGDLRVYQGTDPLALIFVIPRNKPVDPDPDETDVDAQAMLQVGLKQFVGGAGGKLINSRVEALPGSVFPARRIVFQAEFKDRTFNGDGAVLSQARNIVFPFRLTQSASSDFARRWATTFRGDSTTSGNWPKRTFGAIEMVAPTNAVVSADRTELSGEGNGVKFKVKSVAHEYDGAPNFNPGPNETSPVTDSEIEAAFSPQSWTLQRAVTEAAKAGGATKTTSPLQTIFAGSAFGMGGWYPTADATLPRLDVLALHDGRRLWTMQLSWNPKDPTSAQTRDAILSSLRS